MPLALKGLKYKLRYFKHPFPLSEGETGPKPKLVKISVVIPVFLRAESISRALESIFRQSRKPDEIVVVNDGSPRGYYKEIESKFPEVNWVFCPTNQGVAKARNLGIKHASGEWIALLDSDDEWEPDKLKLQEDQIFKNREIKAIHTGEKWIRNGNEVIPPRYLDKSGERLWERSLKHCLICPSSILLHRSVFDVVGWFDESLKVCEDFDFWLRLLLHYQVFLLEDKLVRKHGGHPDQLSTTVWGMDRYRVKSLENLLQHPFLSGEQKNQVTKELVSKSRILSQGARKRDNLQRAQKYESLCQKYAGTMQVELSQVDG